MVRYLFRHYRARARLAARKARGEAMLEEMRNNWSARIKWDGTWFVDKGGGERGEEIGKYLVVGEQNTLGDRRVAVPLNHTARPNITTVVEATRQYADAKAWAAGFEVTTGDPIKEDV